jgi:hypothetical protein
VTPTLCCGDGERWPSGRRRKHARSTPPLMRKRELPISQYSSDLLLHKRCPRLTPPVALRQATASSTIELHLQCARISSCSSPPATTTPVSRSSATASKDNAAASLSLEPPRRRARAPSPTSARLLSHRIGKQGLRRRQLPS